MSIALDIQDGSDISALRADDCAGIISALKMYPRHRGSGEERANGQLALHDCCRLLHQGFEPMPELRPERV